VDQNTAQTSICHISATVEDKLNKFYQNIQEVQTVMIRLQFLCSY